MASPRKVTGTVAALIIVIISILLFYLSYIDIGNKEEAFVVIGLISVLFAIISYLMHAFISQVKVVTAFAPINPAITTAMIERQNQAIRSRNRPSQLNPKVNENEGGRLPTGISAR